MALFLMPKTVSCPQAAHVSTPRMTSVFFELPNTFVVHASSRTLPQCSHNNSAMITSRSLFAGRLSSLSLSRLIATPHSELCNMLNCPIEFIPEPDRLALIALKDVDGPDHSPAR